MTILVTGAAGFIGMHVADRLMGQGHAVVGIDGLKIEPLAPEVSGIDAAGVAGHDLLWQSIAVDSNDLAFEGRGEFEDFGAEDHSDRQILGRIYPLG